MKTTHHDLECACTGKKLRATVTDGQVTQLVYADTGETAVRQWPDDVVAALIEAHEKTA